LGGISGELEIPKSKPTLEIVLWKIDGFEKVGRTISQSINMPQDPPRVIKCWDDNVDADALQSSCPKPRHLFVSNYPWSLTSCRCIGSNDVLMGERFMRWMWRGRRWSVREL
jgi:hypothetical protein